MVPIEIENAIAAKIVAAAEKGFGISKNSCSSKFPEYAHLWGYKHLLNQRNRAMTGGEVLKPDTQK